MKILIVRTHPTEINISSYNVQEIGLSKELTKLGHQCGIVFFTLGVNKNEKIMVGDNWYIDVFWRHGKNILWQGVFDFKQLIGIVRQYDVVQVNEYNQVASYYISKQCGIPCIIYHGPYYNPNDFKYNLLNKLYDVFFLKRMLKLPVKVLAKSTLAEKMLRERGFKNVETVGVGLDTTRFKEEKKEVDNIFRKKNRLLYIGEISERRNTLFLLKVLACVKRVKPDIQLILIGKGERTYMELCKSYINEKNLKNNITWHLRIEQSELYKYYLSASVFLFPTNYDIFGMVLLEAMYFGLPCISSYNGGANTLISELHDGIVIGEFSIQKWTDEIIKLLDNSSLINTISKQARKKILEQYTWESIAYKFIDSYDQLSKMK